MLVAAVDVDQHADPRRRARTTRAGPWRRRRAKRRIDMFSPIFCTSACARAPRPSRPRRACARRARRRRPDCRARRAARASAANARKSVVAGDEVGLAVDLDHRADLARRARRTAPITPSAAIAAGGLRRLGAALDPQQLLGLREVAAGFRSAPSCIPSCPARCAGAAPSPCLRKFPPCSLLHVVAGRARRRRRGAPSAAPARRRSKRRGPAAPFA